MGGRGGQVKVYTYKTKEVVEKEGSGSTRFEVPVV